MGQKMITLIIRFLKVFFGLLMLPIKIIFVIAKNIKILLYFITENTGNFFIALFFVCVVKYKYIFISIGEPFATIIILSLSLIAIIRYVLYLNMQGDLSSPSLKVSDKIKESIIKHKEKKTVFCKSGHPSNENDIDVVDCKRQGGATILEVMSITAAAVGAFMLFLSIAQCTVQAALK